ncbi:SusC/RagA family TonB-linked outer membrane protein [Porphyromonas pogonae]|nr:SusC/RagA family TonB-linked outer membrane protein [Porphyromonas pogonae]
MSLCLDPTFSTVSIDEERRVRATALGGVNKLPDGWDPNKNPYIAETRTDWIKAIFRNAMFQRHNMSLSGGTETFNNLVSFEYSNKNGTLLNTYNREWTTRLNSMYKLSDHIRVREDLTWQKNQLRDANTYSAESGVILSALMMPRNAEVYAPDGSFGGTAPSDKAYITKYGSNFADIHGDVINPVRTLTAGLFENHHSTISSSTFLDIMEPIRGLNFTSRFTYQLENYFDKKFSPKRLEPGKPFDRNFMGYSTFRTTNWSTENTITYERIFNKNSVSLMASTTASEAKYRDFSASAEGFYNEDPSLIYFGQAGKFNPAKDGFWLDRNLSFVVRASYSYDNKYFFSGSWRRDYAGRLPKGRKYGDFPSATLAWKLSSEPFMKDMEALNLLKFRMSWGRIGNLGSIGMGYGYPLLQNYRIGDGDIAGQVGNPPYLVLGKYVAEGYNPNLTWETSEQTNFGIDLGLFDNRLSLTMDYFIKNTKDLIKKQDAGWSHSIGYDPQLVNDGKIRNSGFEMSANWSDKVGALKYWVGGNFATLKNKVISMGQTNSPDDKVIWTDGGKFKDLRPFQTEVGQPIYSFFLVKNSGVFTTKQEIDSYVDKDGKKIQPKAQIGDLKFVDENGDGKISNADRVYMGNAMPKLTYALSGGVSYKNFTFSMMLQGVAGVKIFNAYKYLTLNESQGSFNRSRDILKALDGPNKAVPRITADDPNENFTTPSDFYLEKGDYLRIKNITLGYSLTDLVRKMSLFSTRNSTLDLTFSIDNVATFTSYSGIDPEVGGTGIDAGQYPISRTFSIGLKLNY